MKNKLITIAAALALAVILARVFEKPLLAQIRAALTQNVDEPGRNAFALSGIGRYGTANLINFPVPAGKRYVIESYSAVCSVPNASYLTDVLIQASTASGFASMYATAAYQQTNDAYSRSWVATGTTHLYADPGTNIFLAGETASPSTSNVSCDFSVAGYVINL